MNDIDPRLQSLREVEARIAFAEFHIREQRALVARLSRRGLHDSLAHELLRSMEDSLTILQLRQGDMLGRLQRVGDADSTSRPPGGADKLG